MASPSATPTDARPTPKEALGAAAALGAGVAWLFGRVLFLDSALHGRDVMHHYWPLQAAVTRAFAQGRLPHWDPTSQGGIPLLANIHAGVFYPPNVLYRALEFPRAYAWLLAFHLLVLGMGAWLLMRRYLGHGPALVGALALVFSGPVISLNVYGPFLGALAWLPWVALGLVAVERRLLSLAAAAGALALQLVAGDPMPAIFTGVVVLALVAIVERRPGLLGRAAAAAGLAAGVAAVQLLPSVDLLRASDRAGGVAHHWSLHPARLLELFLPSVFGQYLDQPAFWGNFLSSAQVKIPFLLSVYAGAAALGLALLGLARTRVTAFAAALFGVGLLLALGSGFVAGPLLAVPPLSFFRYPEKYMVVASVGFAFLVAQGAARLGAGARPWRAVGPVVFGLAALALAGPGRPLLDALLRDVSTRKGSRFVLDGAAEAVAASGQTAALFGALVLGLVLLQARLTPSRRLLAVGAVLGLDLALAAQGTAWTGPLDLYSTPPPLVAALEADAPRRPYRIWRDNPALEANVQNEGTYAGIAGRRAFELSSLKTAIGTVWGLEDVSAASAVALGRWMNFMVQVGPLAKRSLTLLNACFAVLPRSKGQRLGLSGERALQLDHGAAVFKFDGCLPRLWSPARASAVASPRAALERVSAPEFDEREEAVVEWSSALSLGGSVEIPRASVGPDGAAVVEVRAPPRGGLLVYSAFFKNGWTAELDGQEIPALAIDGAFVGALVPEGAHQVVFRYLTPLLGLGATLSALALAAIGVLCALGGMAAKRQVI